MHNPMTLQHFPWQQMHCGFFMTSDVRPALTLYIIIINLLTRSQENKWNRCVFSALLFGNFKHKAVEHWFSVNKPFFYYYDVWISFSDLELYNYSVRNNTHREKICKYTLHTLTHTYTHTYTHTNKCSMPPPLPGQPRRNLWAMWPEAWRRHPVH